MWVYYAYDCGYCNYSVFTEPVWYNYTMLDASESYMMIPGTYAEMHSDYD